MHFNEQKKRKKYTNYLNNKKKFQVTPKNNPRSDVDILLSVFLLLNDTANIQLQLRRFLEFSWVVYCFHHIHHNNAT